MSPILEASSASFFCPCCWENLGHDRAIIMPCGDKRHLCCDTCYDEWYLSMGEAAKCMLCNRSDNYTDVLNRRCKISSFPLITRVVYSHEFYTLNTSITMIADVSLHFFILSRLTSFVEKHSLSHTASSPAALQVFAGAAVGSWFVLTSMSLTRALFCIFEHVQRPHQRRN